MHRTVIILCLESRDGNMHVVDKGFGLLILARVGGVRVQGLRDGCTEYGGYFRVVVQVKHTGWSGSS